jgi:hypothetical protein
MEDCMREKRLTDRFILTRRVNSAGWGLFSLWMGAAMIAHFSAGTTLLGVGIITLGTQALSKYMELALDAFSIAAGFLIAAAGVCNLLGIQMEFLPFLCIAAGAFFLISIVAGEQTHNRINKGGCK